MNKIFSLLFLVLFSSLAQAVEMGVPVQLKLQNPSGGYPTASGLTFTVQIMSPSAGCILRQEDFTGQTITSGTISLALGSGSPGVNDPNIPLTAVYNNSAAKNNLTCVDANNNVVSTGQTYNPAATDTRVLRVYTIIAADTIIADFIQRAAPYAMHAESVGGKVAADILVQNGSTSLNQTNLEDLLADATRFNKLKNLAVNGIADSATTATTATTALSANSATTATTAASFTGALLGDVTGVQSATVVSKLRGVTVAATAPSSGQVLAYDGSQYVPTTFVASAPVASVNGKTGSVVLDVADIAGAITSGSALTGDVTGTIAATVVSSVGGKSAAAVATVVSDVNSATTLPTASTIARRDGSGNLTASTVMATNASTQNVYLFEGTNTNSVRLKAPNSFADYILVLPTSDGNSGEYLQTDGSGNLSWAASSVTSATIAAALGFTPANSSLVALKSNNLSDLASSASARTNLGLGGAALLSVGTTAGTVAAGDDSRITGALQQTSFNTYVASASCTDGQSMYWNSVSSTFLCQNILVSGDLSGIVSNATVTKVQGVGVSFSSIASNHILQYNGTNIVNRAIPTCAGGEYLTFNGTAWSCVVDAGGGGSIASLSVTAPISSTGGVNPTLSMAQAGGSANGYLASSDWTTFNNKVSATSAAVIAALGYTPASATALGNYLAKASNLSDLASSASARTNLGLAGAALLNVGTTAGTVAAGDDSRIVNALTASTNYSGDVSGTYNSLVLVNSGVNAGTYTKFTVNAKGLITSGTSLTSSDVTTALGFTPADNAASGTYVVKASNLSDLASATVARTNLGLGSLAVSNFIDLSGSQASGTLASARLPAFSGDASSSVGTSVLTLASVGAGVTSGSQYTKVTVDGKGRVTSGTSLTSSDVTAALGFTPADNAASGTYVAKASNLSDLASSATARTNLGLAGAALLDVGTTAGTVAAGDDARITGSLSQTSFNTYVAGATCTTGQSMYWNSVSSLFACQDITVSGDISGIASSVTVTKIQGVGASFSAIASNHILQYDGTNIINRAIPTCGASQYLTFNGTAWSCASDIGSAGIVSSVAVTSPLQTTGGNAPTLSMTQATGSVSGYLTGADWTTFNSKIASSAAAVAQVLGFSPADSATVLVKSNNLSDLLDVVSARANLGLGGFATVSSLDLGSASATGTLADGRLPAFAGDVTSVAGVNALTVGKIQGVSVDATAPASGQVLAYNGTAWAPAIGLTQYGRVTGNQVIPNTTYVDLTNLDFPVVAGNSYKFRYSVVFSLASTIRYVRFLISSPAVTVLAAQAQVPSSTSAITSTIIAAQSGTATTAAANAVNGQVLIAIIEGIIVPSANGIVKLQASPNNTVNMTVYAGSTMEWTQVP